MILTAHQPMYLPWLGLLDKISRADMYCVFDDVPFERHGYGNRNQIKGANGTQMLTVPVHLKDHLATPIYQIEICNGPNWRRKHLRAIELADQKAEDFDDYLPGLQDIYAHKWALLAGLNHALLKFFLDALSIDVEIVMASEQGFSGAKSGLVLDMCKKLGADEYIFGSMGANYADVGAFTEAGVALSFQDYKHPTYSQLHGEFTSHLSILDLLFNHGPDSLEILRNEQS